MNGHGIEVSAFGWTKKREQVAFSLAEGYTVKEASDMAGISERTIFRWKNNLEFSSEVDRLTQMIGIATRSERLRIAMRVIRGRIDLTSIPASKRDLLEWLKFAQSETDGIKLDLTTIIKDAAQVASAGSDRTDESEESESSGDRRVEAVHK